MERCRGATSSDLDRVVELARALAVEVADQRGGSLWVAREAPAEPLAEAYASLMADPDSLVVVGLIDEVVVGFGSARTETLRTGARLGHLDDLFVEGPARGVGVGEAMMQALIAYLAEHGCVGVDALALPGHRETKNFLEAQGFSARALVMHRPLAPPD